MHGVLQTRFRLDEKKREGTCSQVVSHPKMKCMVVAGAASALIWGLQEYRRTVAMDEHRKAMAAAVAPHLHRFASETFATPGALVKEVRAKVIPRATSWDHPHVWTCKMALAWAAINQKTRELPLVKLGVYVPSRHAEESKYYALALRCAAALTAHVAFTDGVEAPNNPEWGDVCTQLSHCFHQPRDWWVWVYGDVKALVALVEKAPGAVVDNQLLECVKSALDVPC